MIRILGVIFLLLSSVTHAKEDPQIGLCGIVRISDLSWVKKPIKLKISKTNTQLYDEKGLTIEARQSETEITISATKGKKVLAVLFAETHDPIQLVIPEAGFQVLCNTDVTLVKVILPKKYLFHIRPANKKNLHIKVDS